jgi:tRNA threonylcarbamoyl adenosine modification protein YeaZ
MKILALEFSSAERSVAIADGPPGKASILGQAREKGGRDTRAFGMIESALKQAGLSRTAIECIAVGLGPGSYTGIRIAISIAQGWQLAQGVKLLGISSVDCLAQQAKQNSLSGAVALAIDAQRGEFYMANYDMMQTDAARLLEPLRIVSAEAVRAELATGHTVAGPALRDSFPDALNLFPDAGTLARLASERQDFVAGEKLEPIYLRETAFVKAPPPRHVP